MEVEPNRNSYLCVKRQILESVWWKRVTLEKAHVQQQRPSTAKKKQVNTILR